MAETKSDDPPAYYEAKGDQAHPQMGYPPQTAYPPQTEYPPQPGYPPQPNAGPAPPGYGMQHPGMAPQGGVVYYSPQPQVQAYNGPPIDDYCTFSILNMVFCCFWIGLVALLKSNGVRDAKMRGDFDSAQKLSEEALKWNKIGLALGIVFTIIYVGCITLYMLFMLGYFY